MAELLRREAIYLWYFFSVLFHQILPYWLFGLDRGLGTLMAAALGVPLYTCGGGTIPLLLAWLGEGMSWGSAIAFLIAGPATKLTNLGAVKIVLGGRNFLCYIIFSIFLATLLGLAVNVFV